MMTATMPAVGSQQKQMSRCRETEPILRLKRTLWLVLSMLSLSLLLVVLGIYTTTRTETVSVSGYTSGIILTLGSFLGLLGLGLEENRRQLLTAAIVFLSFGVVTSFMCLVIDGSSTVLNMDMRPLRAGRCQHYSSGNGYIYENFYTSVSCWTLEETCNVTVRSGTCYCCDLYNCANAGYLNSYYEFVGVQSCQDVLILYVLVWSLTGLNLVVFFMGVLTTAVLGSIKNMRGSGRGCEPTVTEASSPTAPLLMDTSALTGQQPHPGAPVYFPSSPSSSSVAAPAAIQPPSVCQRYPVLSPSTNCQLAPFAPLPYRA